MDLNKRILIIVGLVLLSLGIAFGCVYNLDDEVVSTSQEEIETIISDTSEKPVKLEVIETEFIETNPIETEPMEIIETQTIDTIETKPIELIETEPIITESIEIETTKTIETEPVFDVVSYVNETYSDEIIMLARLVYLEGRGVASQTEQACIIWTVLNRADSYGQSISEIILAPHQFHYKENARVYDDFGRDLRELARDVLQRWTLEKMGEVDVGRVLPSNYFFFAGKNGHNWFRMKSKDTEYWNYSLISPYDS